MAPKPSVFPSFLDRVAAGWWLFLIGAWLGMTLVKLGNPVILDSKVPAPTDVLELLFQPWPLKWGWWGLVVVVVMGLLFRQLTLRSSRSVGVWAPAVWLLWQCVAAFSTVDLPLTRVTLAHFAVCIAVFYLGVFTRRPLVSTLPHFLWGILLGFVFVLWIGFDQHFGGLEATRRMVYEQVGWENMPRDYLKRLASDRIFATLVYPNALAGAILLLLPVLLVLTNQSLYRYNFIFRAVSVGMLAYLGVACMVWSGSKAGWLLSLVVLGVWLWHVKRFVQFRTIAVILVAVLGICLFGVKYSAYFKKGAPSVGARFDYWSAAFQTLKERPLMGSGPGTFSVMYRAVKSPESEMALLTHNDYLQQGSDSGIPGLLVYLCLFPLGIVKLYRKSQLNNLTFALWLGLLGWSLQGFVEFGLYIPALSCCGFFFLGWLQGIAETKLQPTKDVPAFD